MQHRSFKSEMTSISIKQTSSQCSNYRIFKETPVMEQYLINLNVKEIVNTSIDIKMQVHFHLPITSTVTNNPIVWCFSAACIVLGEANCS